MKRLIILLAVAILAPTMAPAAAMAQEDADSIAKDPEARVDQLVANFTGDETPGVVVGVIEDGDLVFQKAYGMANLSHGIPFDTDTRTNIGSVTKQFTAMGILLLQAEGKLTVQDDVRTHIPELKDFGVPVTLKNLLNHTSGYRELYNLMMMTGYQGEDALRRERAIQVVQRQAELQSEPNTEYNYNNTAFILLATTIERVSEMTFADYMKERVFEPLGMMNTRVKAIQGEVIPHSAQGYAPVEGGGFRQTRDLGASYGAGGIYTTVGDGELYAQATGQPRFKVLPNSDSTATFDGVPASVTFHIEDDGTVETATHHQGGNVPMVRVEDSALSPEQVREYEGRYYSAEIETAYEIRFDEEEGKLKAHSIRLSPMDVTHKEEDEFTLSFGTITFKRSDDGTVTGFTADNGRTRDVWFERQEG